MSEFHFLRPLWLLAFLPLGVLLWLRLRNANDASVAHAWRRVVDAHLLPHLLVPAQAGTKRKLPRELLLGWLIAVVALAGPAWERVPPLRFEPEVPPLVLVLDLSRSMDVRDQAPSRLDVAKAKLRALLDELSPRSVGLVVFAASAHSVMPLTRDVRLIASSLELLDTGLMPAQGSDVTRALDHAARMLSDAKARRGHVLLVTDGTAPGGLEAAARLRESGVRLWVLGLGSDEGGLVPDRQTGYLSAGTGHVRSVPDAAAMQRLADAGGGNFVRARPDDGDTQALAHALGGSIAGGAVAGKGRGEVWRDRGPWLILLLIPLALMRFGRASPWVVAALALTQPPSAQALDWNALWLSPDQRGLAALERGDLAAARDAFRDPVWIGVTQWRLGDAQGALASFERADSVLAHYNRGVVLVNLGRLAEAVDAFEHTLARDPRMDAARNNLELVRKALLSGVDLNAFSTAPRPKERPTPPVPRNNPVPTTPAEENPGGARPEDLTQPMGEAPPGLDRIGSIGSGAMLIRGGVHPDAKETAAAGQSAGGEGAMQSTDEDRAGGRGAGADSADRTRQSSTSRDGGSAQTAGLPADEVAQEGDGGGDGPASGAEPDGAENGESANESAAGSQDTSEAEGNGAGGAAALADTQALEQWLDRIADQPAGLLKEKFRREFRRGEPTAEGLNPW